MFICISLIIQFSTVFQFCQFCQYLKQSVGNVLLKYRKETNIVFFSYIMRYVYLNKNK